jgi:hypothetical protein
MSAASFNVFVSANDTKGTTMTETIRTRNLKAGDEIKDGRVSSVRRELSSRRMGFFITLENGRTVYTPHQKIAVTR